MKRRDRNIFFYLTSSTDQGDGRRVSGMSGHDSTGSLIGGTGTTVGVNPGKAERGPTFRIAKRVEDSKLHLVKVSVVQ